MIEWKFFWRFFFEVFFELLGFFENFSSYWISFKVFRTIGYWVHFFVRSVHFLNKFFSFLFVFSIDMSIHTKWNNFLDFG